MWFWDGKSFVPIYFSLHREKGKKQEALSSQYFKATKKQIVTKVKVAKQKDIVVKKQRKLLGAEKTHADKPNKICLKLLGQMRFMCQKAEKDMQALEQLLNIDNKAKLIAKHELKKFYLKGRL